MKESGPRILNSYHKMPRQPQPPPKAGKRVGGAEAAPPVYNPRKFIETHATSLPDIIRAFPTGNLDITALEAHLWDRLRYYYPYERFRDVPVKKKEEIRFINDAIASIEDWFYGAEWTACLSAPLEDEIKGMFASERNTFLKRVRNVKDREASPNLGRDGRNFGEYHGSPLPNIYDELASGADSSQVYSKHAFKFFHGPAGVLNTLTKVSNQKDILANRRRFDDFIRLLTRLAPAMFKRWGYAPDDPRAASLKGSLDSLNGQSDDLKRCTRTLFFMKTCLEGAEMLRRTGHPRMTRQDFEKVLEWIKATQEKEKNGNRSGDYLPFNFSPDLSFEGSLMHVNAKELPLALFAVDYLRSKQSTGR